MSSDSNRSAADDSAGPRHILVTGGSGFVGSWVLKDLLCSGHTPIVVDQHPAEGRWRRVLGPAADNLVWAEASLADPGSLQTVITNYDVQHIIHLAALLTPACQDDPWLGCQVNVLGSTSVFEAARKAACVRSISYASSYAVYGSGGTENGQAADSPPMFYGAFKQAVDLISEQYWRHFQLPSVAVRPHVVYGPERELGLTAGPSLAACAAARGQEYTIGYTGQVGYDYVEDVARALVRSALECPPGAHVVDLPSEPATTADFVRMIENVVPESRGRLHVEGPAIPTNIPTAPRDIDRLFPDWQATPLSDGVRATVDYYRTGERHP